MTTEALEAFGTTLYFIEMWIKLLDNNYDARRVSYITAMKYMSKQIPTTMTKPLSPEQKVHKFMTQIGGEWYMEKITKRLPPLRRQKLTKTLQDKENEITKLYESNSYWND